MTKVASDTRPDRRRTFQDPEVAREAGRRGGIARQAQLRAEREALQELPEGASGAAAGGTSPAAEHARTQDRAIVQKLQAKAKAGDIAAARELREWRRLDAAQAVGADALRMAQLVAALSASQRRALHAWLIEQLGEQESPAYDHNREGSDDVDRSLPEQEAGSREAEGHPREPRDSDVASGTDSPQR